MNERIWNFNNNLLLSFDNPNLILMTNNIFELNNKYLNSKYHGVCKTFLNFEYAIHELINYYDKKPEYKEHFGSITKSLYHMLKLMKLMN